MKTFFLFYLTFCFIGILNLNAQKNKSESIKNGFKLYRDFCYRCHGFNGEGQTDLIPPLKSSDYLLNNIDLSIAGLKYGLKGKIFVNGKLYDSYMAYQGLDNDEIADIMNYILNEWGNSSEEFVTPERVSKVEKSIIK